MRRRDGLRANAGVADANALAAALLAGALQATGGATLGGAGAGIGVKPRSALMGVVYAYWYANVGA